jgi:hypothetical protein
MQRRVRIPPWMAAGFALFALGIPWGSSANAGVTVYTDPQSFFQAANVESTETFDELPSRIVVGVGSVALDGITYSSDNPFGQWVTSNSFVTVSPPNTLVPPISIASIAAAALTFAAGGYTDGIGFYLVPGSTIPGGRYRFEVTTRLGETFNSDSGIKEHIFFTGFVSSDSMKDGIQYVSITPLQVPGGISNFTMDNVSRGSIVPEPNAVALWTTSIVILLAFSLWRNRRQPSRFALLTDPKA